MIRFINTIRTVGTEPVLIKCECEISAGIGIHVVGLADITVKESLLRTITALQAVGYHIPEKRIVINLAPCDLTKSGTRYDLAIALGIIAASGQETEILKDMEEWLVLGELGLDATIRQIPGAVQTVLSTLENKLKGCIVPYGNANELQRLFEPDVPVYAASSLPEALAIMHKPEEHPTVGEMKLRKTRKSKQTPSWDTLRENEGARRAIKIAAAGGHHLLLMGAPGSQKTSIAKAMHELLPPMSPEETMTTAKIYSVAGRGNCQTTTKRPFRAPHSSATMSALLGGGSGDNIMPGEVSLAHNGILYIDEFEMMPKSVTEAMRGSIEDRSVTISRLKSKVIYPASYQLVAACNPCPCGYYGEAGRCTCTPHQRLSYLARLSSPIMDRIDIQAWVHPVRISSHSGNQNPETLESSMEEVQKAREVQRKRYEGCAIMTNADMSAMDIEKFCTLSDECKDLLEKLIERLSLSARSYTRILKIARTIADLEGHENIQLTDIAEASSFRFLDRRSVIDEFSKEKNA